MQLKKQIGLLKILANGYQKHPACRAINPDIGNSGLCIKMWKPWLVLKKLEKLTTIQPECPVPDYLCLTRRC